MVVPCIPTNPSLLAYSDALFHLCPKAKADSYMNILDKNILKVK